MTYGAKTYGAKAMGISIAVITLAASTGCSVVSRHHLDELSGSDGGQSGDAGQPRVDETCLGPDATPRLILSDTRTGLILDTTTYSNDNSSACGAQTPGNDAFVAIEVQAGAIWHFHLRALTPDREPMLYFAKAGQCDARECEYVSTACEGAGDEHFAFEASESGVWYVGVDDSAPGGGVYRLDAYHPVCGDGNALHGEACDEGDTEGGDGCDRRCRVELSTLRTGEDEPNDNRVEANAIVLPASNELVVTGTSGGASNCTYGDYFAITVPDGGDLQVHALDSDGSACASSITTPFDLVLENSRGGVVLENRVDGIGCATIDAPDLGGGEYFVKVRIRTETETVTPYTLRFRVVP